MEQIGELVDLCCREGSELLIDERAMLDRGGCNLSPIVRYKLLLNEGRHQGPGGGSVTDVDRATRP